MCELMERIGSRAGHAIAPRDHILMPKLVVSQSCTPPRG